MATKISLDNVIETTSDFIINFNFLSITGKADINARLTFLSIMDLEKYWRNPYIELLNCLNESDKEKLKDLSDDDATAYIYAKMIKEDYPPIESLLNSFMKSIAENKAIYINKLFTQMIIEARNNQSLSVEFVAETDEDGISINAKQNLVKELMNLDTLPSMGDMVFNYYKKDFKQIYLALSNSVYDFLAKLK